MKSRFHQINVGTQHCVRPLVSCTVSPRRDSVRWSGSSRVERAFHVASLEKLRQVTSSSPAGIWDSSLLSLFFFPRCVFVSEPGANVVPSFIRRAFNVSVAVSLRLGPPEPHGQAARPRVIDEFVRDGERSALSAFLSRHQPFAHMQPRSNRVKQRRASFLPLIPLPRTRAARERRGRRQARAVTRIWTLGEKGGEEFGNRDWPTLRLTLAPANHGGRISRRLVSPSFQIRAPGGAASTGFSAV